MTTTPTTPQQAGALSERSIEAALEEWFNRKWSPDADHFQDRMRAAISAARINGDRTPTAYMVRPIAWRDNEKLWRSIEPVFLERYRTKGTYDIVPLYKNVAVDISHVRSILASEIECGIFEQHVLPALAVAEKVLADPELTCQTCGGHGMIGGPSYQAPDEGGEPCPDCIASAATDSAARAETDDREFDLETALAIAEDRLRRISALMAKGHDFIDKGRMIEIWADQARAMLKATPAPSNLVDAADEPGDAFEWWFAREHPVTDAMVRDRKSARHSAEKEKLRTCWNASRKAATAARTDDDVFALVAEVLGNPLIEEDLKGGFAVHVEPEDWIKFARAIRGTPAMEARCAQVLSAVVHAAKSGEDARLILDENSPLMDAARSALRSAAPTPVADSGALTIEQREAIEEAICWASDDGLPGTADMLRSVLAAQPASVDAVPVAEFELTAGEIEACSTEPTILRCMARTHEDIASDAETLGDEVRASYHITRASALNAKADAEDRERHDRGDAAPPASTSADAPDVTPGEAREIVGRAAYDEEADMAEVGRALMRAIETFAPEGWHPNDCPSEIVGDLRNMLDEASALAAPAQPAVVPVAVSQAARDVLAERERQVTVEGWTPEHDDGHTNGEMAKAAAAYALNAGNVAPGWPKDPMRAFCKPPPWWPWDRGWWKPDTLRWMLVKAGALILAEMERIDRAASAPAAPQEKR